MARLIQRGGIYWYRFDLPDKKRPVLVLTRDSVIDYLHSVTIAPISTTIRNIPTEIEVGQLEGLPAKCAINLDHVQTVSKEAIGDRLGQVGISQLEQVKTALSFALGF